MSEDSGLLERVGNVGKVGRVGKVGKVGKVGRVGRSEKGKEKDHDDDSFKSESEVISDNWINWLEENLLEYIPWSAKKEQKWLLEGISFILLESRSMQLLGSKFVSFESVIVLQKSSFVSSSELSSNSSSTILSSDTCSEFTSKVFSESEVNSPLFRTLPMW